MAYFVNHKVRKGILGGNRFETEAAARNYAEWLANTYGGRATVSTQTDILARYTAKGGWKVA